MCGSIVIYQEISNIARNHITSIIINNIISYTNYNVISVILQHIATYV